MTKTYESVIGDMTIPAERLQYVDFTVPYAESGLSMIVTEKSQESPLMFTKPFNWPMWMLTWAILIYTMLIVWYLERGPNQRVSWQLEKAKLALLFGLLSPHCSLLIVSLHLILQLTLIF